jgi:uncharacterized membrane protein
VTLAGLLVWAHISLMFSAVTISYGPVLMFVLALQSGRTERLRAVTVAVQPVTRLIPVFYGLGALAGLAAALVIGFNLLAPWLVISYVLFVVLTGIGAALVGPRLQRVAAMVGPLPDGPLPDEVRAAVTAGGFLWIELLDFIGIFTVIFVMVVKPFS